jgi:hypothetical protein
LAQTSTLAWSHAQLGPYDPRHGVSDWRWRTSPARRSRLGPAEGPPFAVCSCGCGSSPRDGRTAGSKLAKRRAKRGLGSGCDGIRNSEFASRLCSTSVAPGRLAANSRMRNAPRPGMFSRKLDESPNSTREVGKTLCFSAAITRLSQRRHLEGTRCWGAIFRRATWVGGRTSARLRGARRERPIHRVTMISTSRHHPLAAKQGNLPISAARPMVR